MGDDDGPLEDLRELPTVVSRSYDGVDPGTLLTTLEGRLESGPYGRITVEELSLEGSDGKLVAVTDLEAAGTGTVEYRPYGPHGAMAVVVGLLFALPSFFITIFLSFLGMYFYAKETEAEFPVARRTALRALLTVSDDGETTTVTYAGDTVLTVDTDRLQGYDLAHRKAVVAAVTDWHSRITDGNPYYETFDDVFFGQHIDAWWNRNAGADAETVRDLEAEIRERLEWQGAYTEGLLETAPESASEDLTSGRPTVDLEAIAEDLDRHLERGGTNA